MSSKHCYGAFVHSFITCMSAIICHTFLKSVKSLSLARAKNIFTIKIRIYNVVNQPMHPVLLKFILISCFLFYTSKNAKKKKKLQRNFKTIPGSSVSFKILGISLLNR